LSTVILETSMLKLLIIGFKDVRLVFRDRAALMLMLLAPFVLTIGLGFVTGRFGGNSGSGLSDIPVAIVNLDKGQLGNALVDVFKSADLNALVKPTELDSSEAARRLIDEDKSAAAVIIPKGFTESIIPSQAMLAVGNYQPAAVKIEVYANPSRPTGAGVIKAIVDEFISRVEEGRISSVTSISGIPGIEKLSTSQVEALAKSMFGNADKNTSSNTAITLKTDTKGANAVDFDPLAYMAPGMALMFLMYTVSYGGRSILAEYTQGTMPRLLVSPTTSAQILGGKVLGIFLTGVAQMGILILASTLFFQVKWGDPLGVTVLIAVAVFGATGWGMLITALARTPSQVAGIGSTLMLIFGILGGSFINLEQMPPYIRSISNITPNAWGLDGFTTLALGGTLVDLGKPILALALMGALLFAVSTLIFSRSNLMKK
jgi:ABC-2 type transport system permease protein